MTLVLPHNTELGLDNSPVFRKLAMVSVTSLNLDAASDDDENDTVAGSPRSDSVSSAVLEQVSTNNTSIFTSHDNYTMHSKNSPRHSHKKSRSVRSLHSQMTSDAVSLVVNNDAVKRNLENIAAREKNAAGKLSNKGEIVSFYVKKKGPNDKLAAPLPVAGPKKKVKQIKEKRNQSKPLVEKQEVVLLDTSDPDLFYSLAAKDKFGRAFEMNELQNKIVLVKLNKDGTEQQPVLKPVETALTAKKTIEPEQPNIKAPKKQDPNFFYSLSLMNQFGKEIEMSRFKGKVVLIVNTASKCKLAAQMEMMQTLYEKYQDQGLEILAFPTSQFGLDQELKNEDEILQFCKVNYGVTYPIMKKISVNGKEEHILYTYLKNVKRKYFGLRRVTWNFEKFIVDRNGKVVRRAASLINMSSIEATIQKLLLEELKA